MGLGDSCSRVAENAAISTLRTRLSESVCHCRSRLSSSAARISARFLQAAHTKFHCTTVRVWERVLCTVQHFFSSLILFRYSGLLAAIHPLVQYTSVLARTLLCVRVSDCHYAMEMYGKNGQKVVCLRLQINLHLTLHYRGISAGSFGGGA